MIAIRRRHHASAALGALWVGLALAASPALAQVDLGGHDSTLPIEITADSLTVRQQEQLATFQGNVDAVQGDLVLRADELRVFYAGSGDGDGGDEAAVRRIEATGNVLITSPQETAEGRRGVYDVAANRVSLEGAVVLTRDANVIRGAALDIDLASGVATMRAAPDAPREERVRAVFVPGQATGN